MTNLDRTISAPNAKDLQPLIEHIEKYYDGNVLILTEWLDRAIYMFHYLPCDKDFTPLQRQNTCEALNGIKETFMEVYFKQNQLSYTKI